MGSRVERGSTAQALAALAALRSLPGASVAVFDRDLRYLLVSGPAAGVPGVDNAELEGRLIAEVQPGECWAVWEPVARAALRGEANSVELMARDERWYRVDVGPWRSPEGPEEGGVALVTDITDQTRALTLAEGMLESTPDATVVVDGNGFIVRVNAQAEKLFGYDRGELLAQRIEILVPEHARSGHADQRSRYSADPHQREIGSARDLFGRRKDGGEFPVEVSLSPLETEAGRLISSTIRDVSGRKRLEGLAGYLVAVVQASGDAIIGRNLNGTIESWNPGAEQLYGYPAAEAVGQSIGMLIPPGHDDEMPALMRRLGAGERIDQFETVRRCKDGAVVDVSLTLSPILDPDDRVIGVSTIARDITEPKRAAAALAEARADIDRFFELSPDLMAVGDAEGRFVRVSPAFESVLGYELEEVVGRSFTDFVHPDDIERTRAIVAERAAGRFLGEYGNRYRCKDGSYRWIMWNTIAADGGLTLGTGRDVTERREMEEALRGSERLAAVAFDHSPQGIVLQGPPPDSQVIQVNQACADMLGYTREEILGGVDLSRQRQELGPDAPTRAALVTGEIDRTSYEKRYVRADGNTVWAHVSSVALCEPGTRSRCS